MKKMWMLIILPLLAIAFIAAVISLRKPDSPSNSGGVITNNTDLNAPKSIGSTEILSFDCSIATTSELRPDSYGRQFYTFKAVCQNGVVTGSYYGETPSFAEKTLNGTFEIDSTFMSNLQNIVAKHNLAKYNGISYRVSGILPKLGVSINVSYATGENISASNNQSNFFAEPEMKALESFFYSAAFEKS